MNAARASQNELAAGRGGAAGDVRRRALRRAP
jgi:hypothetical protein